jgi:DNA-binding NtrC family response regulator
MFVRNSTPSADYRIANPLYPTDPSVETKSGLFCQQRLDFLQRSGISIYKELRTSAELRHIPVIIISGFSPESGNMADNFRKMIPDESIPAPNGFMDKPMNLDRLITMIHETLEMARQGSNT